MFIKIQRKSKKIRKLLSKWLKISPNIFKMALCFEKGNNENFKF